jgi:hypothetical protein
LTLNIPGNLLKKICNHVFMEPVKLILRISEVLGRSDQNGRRGRGEGTKPAYRQAGGQKVATSKGLLSIHTGATCLLSIVNKTVLWKIIF